MNPKIFYVLVPVSLILSIALLAVFFAPYFKAVIGGEKTADEPVIPAQTLSVSKVDATSNTVQHSQNWLIMSKAHETPANGSAQTEVGTSSVTPTASVLSASDAMIKDIRKAMADGDEERAKVLLSAFRKQFPNDFHADAEILHGVVKSSLDN
jgi:hypothetical protein